MSLRPRARRAVAAVGVLAFLAFYIWAVVTIGQFLPDNPWVQLAYYGLAGILWGVPLLPLITWAERGGKR